MFKRVCDKPELAEATGEHITSLTLSPDADLTDILPPDVPIAVDVETVGEDGLPLPWQTSARLVCVGFAVGTHRFAFPSTDRAAIDRWLETPNLKVFHNSAYDLPWLLGRGFHVAGEVHDTLWTLAFANGVAAKGLKAQGNGEYPVYLPKDSALYPQQVLDYCANDAAATLALYTKGSSWTIHRLYQMYSRMAPRVAVVCLRGLPVLAERVRHEIQKTRDQRDRVHAELRTIADINWSGDKAVRTFFGPSLILKTRTGLAALHKKALLRCTNPAAPVYREFTRTRDDVRDFLEPLADLPCTRGIITLGGAYTGRTSASNRLQGIPKRYRHLYGRPEYDWLKLDFAGADLVVLAVLSGCQALLQVFREGRDLHREVVAGVFGVARDQIPDDLRKRGKALNFAMTYGGSEAAILSNAEDAGITMTWDEAAGAKAKWFRMFPEVRDWQNTIAARLGRGQAIESAFGRQWQKAHGRAIRWTEALAAPVASTTSDLLLFVVDAMWERLAAIGDVVNFVHDEVDLLVPKGAWPEIEGAVREIAQAMAGIDPRFPMRVEVAVGPSWGETQERFTVGGAS
jgi:hypothetical protein